MIRLKKVSKKTNMKPFTSQKPLSLQSDSDNGNLLGGFFLPLVFYKI